MLVAILASGSEGNCTLIDMGSKKILIDLGMNNKYICDRLKEYNILPNEIDYVFVTHTHSDHTGAMKTFLKKNNPYLFVDEEMMSELEFLSDYPNLSFDKGIIELGELTVETFKTSHDAPGSRGYIFKYDDKSIVYVTDTGYINNRLFDKLTNHDMYIFESNHDIEMLMHGRYPAWLKKRVSSDLGHLSNNQAAFYLSRFIGNKTKNIVLAHLSHENNTPDIALNTVVKGLRENDVLFNNILIAKQRESVEIKL